MASNIIATRLVNLRRFSSCRWHFRSSAFRSHAGNVSKRDLTTSCIAGNLHRQLVCPRVMTGAYSNHVDRSSFRFGERGLAQAAADAAPSEPGKKKREFQAETRMLLDIVAKSLYSDKEVFIRELISNASDALEKLRYLQLTSADQLENKDSPLEIRMSTDKMSRTFTIEDTGVGMTEEEMVESLGTIARSGSRAFLEEIKKAQPGNESNIIGQFGVGFYSTFMVADKVEVFSRSCKAGSKPYKWTCEGTMGTYEIEEADEASIKQGTRIVLHLKRECEEFATEEVVQEVIKKYSNFVGSPISLNSKRVNTVQALWLLDPKDVTKEMHAEFYKFISNAYDVPRYYLHFRTDVPINLRALLYIPEGKPGLFEMSRDVETGVALYSHRVLIKSKTDNVLPKWLRFVKGIVDSEDIPLNLSREFLQNSALIRKIRMVLTSKLMNHLADQRSKDPEGFDRFYKDYCLFLKEGIVSGTEQAEKEEIGKLLQFDSSLKEPGESVTLADYVQRMKPGQSDIYYLAAPSRHLAENSPYYEAVKQKDVEVLFCYEPYDELVLVQLRQFKGKNLTSVEKEMRRDKEEESIDDVEGGLNKEQVKGLIKFLESTLGKKIHKAKVTKRLEKHPCLVSVEEMAAARHFIRTSYQGIPEQQRYELLELTLEINPSHPIMKKISAIKDSNPKLAELLTKQVFDNAMVTAGLVDDPRHVMVNMNDLLTMLLEKH